MILCGEKLFTTEDTETTENISAPAAAKNGSPARNDIAIAVALNIDDAPDIAHHSTTGIHAKVVRLFEMSIIDSVGPQSIRITAPISAPRGEPMREKSRNAPQPRSAM